MACRTSAAVACSRSIHWHSKQLNRAESFVLENGNLKRPCERESSVRGAQCFLDDDRCGYRSIGPGKAVSSRRNQMFLGY